MVVTGARGTFLDRLSDEMTARLHGAGRVTRFARGTALMYPGQVGDSVHVLLRGCVKIWSAGAEGRETLLGFRDVGDLVGELAVADEQPRSSGVIAVEDVESLIIGAPAFRTLTRAEPQISEAVIQVLAGRLRDADIKRAEHAGGDGVARVSSRLVELVERFGEDDADGVRITLPITQAELAGWTGSSIETVGRALATMRGLGWINTKRRTIVVQQLDAVRARAAG